MIPYLKVLIRQRIAAWNPLTMASVKKSKGKAIANFAIIALSMLMLYAMLVVLEYYMYQAFAQIGEPGTMLALTAVLCTLMTIITSFFYILSELFFSKDVSFVSSLPMSSREILTAKLLRIWLGEAGIALLICLPVVVLYGIGQAMNVGYYLKALLLIPFIPMAPIAVITLLSFALIRISSLWKRREALTVLMSMAFMVAIIWLEMSFSFSSEDSSMSAAIIQTVFQQKTMLEMIAGLYPPVQWYANSLMQSGIVAIGNWLGFAALNTALLAAVTAAVGGVYQRLAIKQNETLTRMNASAKRRVDRHGMRSPFRALFRREIREIFIVPTYAMNCLSTAVVFPVIAVVMMITANNANSELSALPSVLRLVPAPLMTAIAIAVFAFSGGMNMAASTAVSREGVRHEFFRTLPVKPQTQLLAKLAMGMVISLIGVLPIAVILFVVIPAFRVEIAIAFLCALLFTFAITTTGLMVDAAHPKFGWKNETEAIKQNGMAALTMFGGMGFVAACGGAYYGLSVLGLKGALILVILCAAVLIIDVLLFRRLLGKASETYILQEVEI
ncbi:MAG: hypothetical protein PHY64_12335 [Eubacteriales bacterium]|nr:hypothetical protein [Eubacteriales bacterium]